MSSEKYWEKREAESLKRYLTDEKEYSKRVKEIYTDMLDNVQAEIDSFYSRYASKEGITIAEAKKRVSKLDMDEYERKAKRYVKDREFSKVANEEMRIYNLTMKVNRLEMLKAKIGLALVSGHAELEEYMSEILKGRTEDELERQAGILGETVLSNDKKAEAIVNASFHNATFSDRIWMNQNLLKSELSKLLQSGLIQGKNPRVLARNLRKRFSVSISNAERLMRTELARVQTEAQKQSFERNGFEQYTFLANVGCCPICQKLNGKHFKVKDMMPGKNASPMHPNCVLPGTKIIAPDMEAMTRSFYSGDVIEFGTSNGAGLTITPNHIMLTARGWVRAKNLVKGDKVINYCGNARNGINTEPANNDCSITVENLFASILEACGSSPISVPVSPEYLKGDVMSDGKIDVVFINSKLRGKLNATVSQFVSDSDFVGAAKVGKVVLPFDCSIAKLLVGFGLASDGIMSGTDIAEILFRGSLTHHELVSFRRPSDYNTRLLQTATDNAAANAESLCDGIFTESVVVKGNDHVNVEVNLNTFKSNAASGKTPFDGTSSYTVGISDLVAAFPGVVSFDDIVFVSNKFYSGHVYDASSLSTLYICNGILSSNCRCSTAAYEDSEEYEAWLDYLDKGGTTAEWEKVKKKRQTGGKDITGGKWYEPYDENDKKDAAASREYRKISRRNDVDVIAKNSGFKKEEIQQIKRHIFYNKHKKYDGYGMLYPDYDMAVAWNRIYNGNPQDRDILLLNHELLESSLEKEYNLTIAEAHKRAKKVYDWEKKLVEDLGEDGEPYGLL